MLRKMFMQQQNKSEKKFFFVFVDLYTFLLILSRKYYFSHCTVCVFNEKGVMLSSE